MLARLEKCRQSSSYVMALAIDGRELDSVELSQKLEKLGTDGISHDLFDRWVTRHVKRAACGGGF